MRFSLVYATPHHLPRSVHKKRTAPREDGENSAVGKG
jgi:hypothetical protein